MKSKFDPLFDVNRKNIAIAGACGGLGRPISEFLHKRGARLFLVDQNQTKLSSLAETLTGSKSICANICDEVQTEKVAAKIENECSEFKLSAHQRRKPSIFDV